MQIAEMIIRANRAYDDGDYKSALKYAEKILRREPSNNAALVIKGNVYFQNRRQEESLQCYLLAVEADSRDKIALANAANGFFELKKYEQSYDFSQRVLALDSADKTALTIYGNSALELEKYDEGKSAFLQLLERDSSEFWSYNSLSRIYQKTGDFKRSLACGWKAVELSAGEESQHINFGYLLYELRLEKCAAQVREYARRWQEKYGENSIVAHMAGAVLHDEKISRAAPQYVRQIFDAFAPEFEQVLNGLEYRAPQLIAAELKRIYNARPPRKMQIADAGCGTGFCGGFLKKYAGFRKLYGIDISEKMLEQARLKKIYDKLILADIETYFSAGGKKFDLIVSADVLTYIGDLKTLMSGMADSLVSGGRIIFTVSKNDVDDSDYYLHASGRFLHRREYIEKLVAASGLKLEKMTEETLRNEGENQVIGYVVSVVKEA